MHNKILWTITTVAVIAFIFSAATFNEYTSDKGLLISGIVLLISGAWLVLFGKVNEKTLENL